MITLIYIVLGMVLFPVIAAGFAGWGTLLGKICRINFTEGYDREEKILTGIFLLYLLAGIWNFFLPAGRLFAVLFFIPGLCLTLFFRKEIKWDKGDFLHLVLLFVFSFFALGAIKVHDTYLYYLDTIRWINEYAVVPGLANVHSRLGFNQFYFYFPALLEAVLPGTGLNFANPFLGFIAAAIFIDSRRVPADRYLAALLLGCIAAYSLRGELSSASPDTAVTFLMLIMFFLFARQLREKSGGRFTFFLFFAVTGVLTKLSFAVAAAGIVFIVFLQEKEKIKVLFRSLPFTAVLCGVWMLRSIYLTGYLVYPVHFLAFDVPWKLSLETVRNEQLSIIGWARKSGPDCMNAAKNGISYWIKGYILEKGHIFLTYFRVFVTTAALWIYFSEKNRKNYIRILQLYFPIAAGLIFWWCTAPDPRFAYPLLFFSVLYPAAAAFERFSCTRSAFWTIVLTVFLIFLPPAAAPKFLYQLISKGKTPRLERVCEVKFTDHGVPLCVTPDIPLSDRMKQDPEKATGKVSLPSTPYYNADLKFLGKGIKDGFVIRKKNTVSTHH